MEIIGILILSAAGATIWQIAEGIYKWANKE